MIIKNAEDLNSFLKQLQNYISKDGTLVEFSHLAEIFSTSQGFKTKADFDLNLPIYVDCCSQASQKLVDQLQKSDLANQLTPLNDRHLLKRVADQHRPFSVSAGPGSNLYLSINWRYEDISIPFQDSTSSSESSAESYGHTTRFKLPHSVYEEEYTELCKQLRPLVARVASGYTDNGEDANATFNSDAVETIANIKEFICNFNFEQSSSDGICPEEILYADLPEINDIVRNGLTEIKSNGELILNHAYSDIDLKKLVARQASEFGIAFNNPEFYEHLKGLRDACQDNFEVPISKSA